MEACRRLFFKSSRGLQVTAPLELQKLFLSLSKSSYYHKLLLILKILLISNWNCIQLQLLESSFTVLLERKKIEYCCGRNLFMNEASIEKGGRKLTCALDSTHSLTFFHNCPWQLAWAIAQHIYSSSNSPKIGFEGRMTKYNFVATVYRHIKVGNLI